MNIEIILIDDEIDLLNTFTKMLNAFGYTVHPFSDADSALNYLSNNEADIILSDLLMPEKDGVYVINKSNELKLDIPIIILSAYGTIERAVECIKLGAFDFVEKPFNSEYLNLLIQKAVNYKKLSNEKNILQEELNKKYSFANIIGQSKKILEVFELIKCVADSDVSVLISGESGTGKELIARAIHTNSQRKNKKFVAVNCGAIPESLFESELFGHTKGSFTDAYSEKIGLLQLANSGTFFMDEIFELPKSLQTKLLRALQEKSFRKIGGTEEISTDFRLISASNKDVEEYLNNDLIRKDFYYRINVVNINVPPLRERIEDIPLLVNHFIAQSNSARSKNITTVNTSVIDAFENYEWPGNVRELENVIERAITFTKGEEIQTDAIPEKIRRSKFILPTFVQENISLKEAKQLAVAKVEKDYLLKLLETCKGDVEKVAELTEMTKRNLYRLINQYSIDLAKYRR